MLKRLRVSKPYCLFRLILVLLYLIGVVVGIGFWIYYGALLFARHADEDIQMAAIVYFAMAGVAFIFVGKESLKNFYANY